MKNINNKKLLVILCILSLLLFPFNVYAEEVNKGSYFASGWIRKQVFDTLFPAVILVVNDTPINLTSWRTPILISDFDLRGKTVFFAIEADMATMPSGNPDNVYVYDYDYPSVKESCTLIDYYQYFYAYDEYIQLKLWFYKVDIPTSWANPCYNLNFTQFWSSSLPTYRSTVAGTVPYDYVVSYDLGMCSVTDTGLGSIDYTSQLQTIINNQNIENNTLSSINTNTYQVNNKLSQVVGYLDSLETLGISISRNTYDILEDFNLLLNKSAVDDNNIYSASSEYAELDNKSSNLINEINQVEKPSVNDVNLDADIYVSEDDITLAGTILNTVFNNNLILSMLLIVASMSVASFFIFGKKQ